MSPVAYIQLLIGATIYAVTHPVESKKFERTAEGYCSAVMAADAAIRDQYQEFTLPKLEPDMAGHIAFHVSKIVLP